MRRRAHDSDTSSWDIKRHHKNAWWSVCTAEIWTSQQSRDESVRNRQHWRGVVPFESKISVMLKIWSASILLVTIFYSRRQVFVLQLRSVCALFALGSPDMSLLLPDLKVTSGGIAIVNTCWNRPLPSQSFRERLQNSVMLNTLNAEADQIYVKLSQNLATTQHQMRLIDHGNELPNIRRKSNVFDHLWIWLERTLLVLGLIRL